MAEEKVSADKDFEMGDKLKKDRPLATQRIESCILSFRGKRVIVDRDLAKIYEVETRRLNEQVKRNRDRFPEDFTFQVTREEAEMWRRSRSQSATLKRGQNLKYLPYAFTEHGALMAANLLNSRPAIRMSVLVVRAFSKIRELAMAQREFSQPIDELERRLKVHDEQTKVILRAIRQLMADPGKPTEKIGFHPREKRAVYGIQKEMMGLGRVSADASYQPALPFLEREACSSRPKAAPQGKRSALPSPQDSAIRTVFLEAERCLSEAIAIDASEHSGIRMLFGLSPQDLFVRGGASLK